MYDKTYIIIARTIFLDPTTNKSGNESKIKETESARKIK